MAFTKVQTVAGIKSVLNVPWEGTGPLDRYSNRLSEISSYEKVPLVYRAIRLRCNGLSRVPYYIYEGKYKGGKEVDEYEYEKDFPMHDLLWLSEASILLAGAAYLLKLQNEFGYERGLQWLNPATVKYDRIGGRMVFWQEIPGGERYPKGKKYWTKEDFLYLRDFNPSDDEAPGTSATSVALTDAQSLLSTSNFLSNFFTADALPITMVIAPAGINSTEATRIEKWFKDKIVNLRKSAASVLGVSGDIKLEKLTSTLDTFAFDQTDNHAIMDIAWAFDIPKTVLTADSANRSTAEVEYRTFLDHTIVPRCRFYESMLNPFLSTFNQRIEFAPEELPEMQIDESERAVSLVQLVNAKVPLLAALDILGYDLTNYARGIVEKAVADGKTDPPPERLSPPGVPSDADMVKTELDRWMRKVMNRLKKGEKALVEFESDIIPEAVKVGVLEALKISETEDQVKAVFKKAYEV